MPSQLGFLRCMWNHHCPAAEVKPLRKQMRSAWMALAAVARDLKCRRLPLHLNNYREVLLAARLLGRPGGHSAPKASAEGHRRISDAHLRKDVSRRRVSPHCLRRSEPDRGAVQGQGKPPHLRVHPQRQELCLQSCNCSEHRSLCQR